MPSWSLQKQCFTSLDHACDIFLDVQLFIINVELNLFREFKKFNTRLGFDSRIESDQKDTKKFSIKGIVSRQIAKFACCIIGQGT